MDKHGALLTRPVPPTHLNATDATLWDIERDPKLAYRYTNSGNLVAVVSNGTAVLGLGDIGPSASKPVMEGKGILFKKFPY